MEAYAFSHCPDPTILHRDFQAARADLVLPLFETPRPTFAETCTVTAAEFRALAQDWYDLGDQRRGDQMTARGLAWEMAGQTGDLAWVRP